MLINNFTLILIIHLLKDLIQHNSTYLLIQIEYINVFKHLIEGNVIKYVIYNSVTQIKNFNIDL